MAILLVACTAYLIGSIPFAVLVSRAMGLADPRGYGSGNPGATNVLRTGNKVAALLTLIGDAAKGGIAVALASLFQFDDFTIAIAGLSAFIGHLFPITLAFKGGKGVATALGVLLALGWKIALGSLAVWLAVVLSTRISSAAALAAAVAAPVFATLTGSPPAFVGVTVIMAALLIWRHTPNIKRILNGTESRVGTKGQKPKN
ncbi:MAG: glycerol-3-phosphate 1-O-acyltransferase PlsY [Zoogloeaceae bacterium]|nr:glycerol-3-phosphate 1-O-acyltransferase PlsY [Zoogloeaceae bacterium]